MADLGVRYVLGFHNGFLPYEDLSIIRRGVLENSDKPRLHSASRRQHLVARPGRAGGPRRRQAASVAHDQRAQATLLFEDQSGPAKLRVIKVASTSVANVGDVVDFTIRYDNMGDRRSAT